MYQATKWPWKGKLHASKHIFYNVCITSSSDISRISSEYYDLRMLRSIAKEFEASNFGLDTATHHVSVLSPARGS